MRSELVRGRCPWRILRVLALALVISLPAWGNLTEIEAGRFTVRGCEGLFLKIGTNAGAGKRIQITIEANQITFLTDQEGRVETGCLVIPPGATEAKVELLDPVDKAWPVCCTIPLSEVPKDGYARVPSCQDLAPPRTTLTADPAPNRQGWNNTPVTVHLASADDKSGTAKLCYTVSGGFTQAERCLTFTREAYCGIAPSAAETSFTVSREGITAVSWYGVDAWGNKEATRTAEVRIDMTKPTLSYTLEPKPNEHGWNNTDVRVIFQAHDALSGLEAAVPEQVVRTEGKDQSVTATARDKAGNTTTLTVRGINIDKTKPTVQFGEPRGTRGNAGWYVSDVTVPYTATDNLSGFAPDGRLSVNGSPMTSEEGRSVFLPVRVSDRAGNVVEARAGPFMIDRTKPRIRLETASEPGKAVISWEVSDTTSGVDTGSCTVSVAGPGITGVGGWRTLSRDCHGQVELRYEDFGAGNFTVRIYARDVAGNEAAEEASVTLEQPLGGRVLICYSNGGGRPNAFDPGQCTYDRLSSHYEARGLLVTYTGAWPDDLSSFCLIILPIPGWEDDSGVNFYTTDQVEALKQFLQKGGRLVILGDHSGEFGIHTVNDLLVKLGVGIIQNDDAHLGGYDSEPTSDITAHPLTEGVNSFQFAATSSLTVRGLAESLVRGPQGVVLVAVDRPAWISAARGGEVVVSGDCDIIDDAWFDDGDGDNLRFFENLAALCIGGGPMPSRPPCAEPENALEAACPITLPFTGRFAIETSGDRDFFRFSLAERTSIRIEVAAREIGSELDSYLCLYDRNGREITCDDDSGPDTDSLITITLDPGVYSVEVRPYSGTGAYELRIRGLALCAEPGDSLERACPITLPFTGRFAIETSGDRDFFRFSLAERTSIRIEVAAREIGSGLDSYLCLYDRNGRDVTCDDDSGPDTDSLITITLDPGVYYVEVRPYSGTGAYELRIRGLALCAEPGDSLERACPITLPFTGRFAIETSGDRDFFRFSLAERTSIRIEVAAREIGSGLDSYLCLYDRNGRDVTCDDDSGPDTDSLITMTLDPGVYYVEVRPYSGTGAYELRVQRSGH